MNIDNLSKDELYELSLNTWNVKDMKIILERLEKKDFLSCEYVREIPHIEEWIKDNENN